MSQSHGSLTQQFSGQFGFNNLTIYRYISSSIKFPHPFFRIYSNSLFFFSTFYLSNRHDDKHQNLHILHLALVSTSSPSFFRGYMRKRRRKSKKRRLSHRFGSKNDLELLWFYVSNDPPKNRYERTRTNGDTAG